MKWEKILSNKRLRPSNRTENKNDIRNQFESDYGRVVFSPAVRRMHDKTQVFPLTSDDNIHTRLTHSMEVSSIAQSLGLRLCTDKDFQTRSKISEKKLLREIPVILAAVSLCHDIGNPPFGHYGEKVISQYFENYFNDNNNTTLENSNKLDFTKFNGNAQGFRVLTRLQYYHDLYGLNLSIGTLSAFLKYPNTSEDLAGNNSSSADEETKVKEEENYKDSLGIYKTEKDILKEILETTKIGKNCRNPLAFLMEAADSICYTIMDIEDGYNSGFYKYNDIEEYLNKKFSEIVDKMTKEFNDKDKFPKGLKDNAKIIFFRTYMIQELIDECIRTFIANIKEIEEGTFIKELLYYDDNGLGKYLKKFCINNIFRNKSIQCLEITGRSVINGLLDHFVNDIIGYKEKNDKFAENANRLFGLISRSIKKVALEQSDVKDENEWYKMSDYFKLRMIVDYISGMTDSFALNLYQRLQGIKIG